ncbi:hypothetical protein ACET3Z_015804 [Daucus carota]
MESRHQLKHQTPGREFLLRVSYLEIYNEVINDLLDPTVQNLRVREDAQERCTDESESLVAYTTLDVDYVQLSKSYL